MNLTSWLPRFLRSSPDPRAVFSAEAASTAPAQPHAPALARPAELRLTPGADGLRALAAPVAQGNRRVRRSWFGWIFGRNRRRDGSARLVQGEFLLTQVRPVRNDFRDTEGEDASRLRGKVLYETPPAPQRRDDQDHAWNRLRNRRPGSLVVSGD
ncbi:MAG: hypothetical protein KIT22_07750 [Verrucomicrobiae bacterium]|nr:hypothetical protein [Verrucomicrobiae bacterium]